MFVRTRRLMLRPGWIEDAPELARAIGHWEVVRHLGRAPWPYAQGDAQAFLAEMQADPHACSFLICARDGDTAPIVGGIGYGPYEGRSHELGYWVAPWAWGRGYATEAGHAVIDLARAMGVRHLTAGHFVDNPASGAVLRKLGFLVTGRSRRHSAARNDAVESVDMERPLTLQRGQDDDNPVARMAA